MREERWSVNDEEDIILITYREQTKSKVASRLTSR